MKNLERRLYLFAGCIGPIFIGALHTYVHFKDLILPSIQKNLQIKIEITGQSQPVPIWNSWGIMSFMMGISFIIIGILNFSIIKNLNENQKIPTLPILAMIIYYFAVLYVGYTFNGQMQLYGGMFGLGMMIFCIYTNFKK